MIVITARWAAASAWLALACACKHVDFAPPGRRTGIILRGDVISPVRQATLPRQGLIGDGARVFSRRTVSQRPGNSGLSTPVPPAATRYDPGTRSSAPGSPWGSQSGVKGDGRARTKGHQPSQDQECRGPPSAPGICQQGQDSQVTCAPVVMAHCSSWLVLPKPEEATTTTGGSPADSSLRSRAARCTRAVGQGTAIS